MPMRGWSFRSSNLSLGVFLSVNMFTGAVLLDPALPGDEHAGPAEHLLVDDHSGRRLPDPDRHLAAARLSGENPARAGRGRLYGWRQPRIYTLRRVVLPLAVPGLIVVGVSVFIGAYAQQYLFAITFNQVAELQPLPAGLNQFIGYQTVEWNQMMAAALTGVLPVMAGVPVPAEIPRRGPDGWRDQRVTKTT